MKLFESDVGGEYHSIKQLQNYKISDISLFKKQSSNKTLFLLYTKYLFKKFSRTERRSTIKMSFSKSFFYLYKFWKSVDNLFPLYSAIVWQFLLSKDLKGESNIKFENLNFSIITNSFHFEKNIYYRHMNLLKVITLSKLWSNVLSDEKTQNDRLKVSQISSKEKKDMFHFFMLFKTIKSVKIDK